MKRGRKGNKELYDHGLPFPEDFANEVITPCIQNLKRTPSILVIDGPPGTGKTTLAVHIADYVNGSPMDLSKDSLQLAMGGDDLINKAEPCSKKGFKVLIFDEADLDKRQSLTKYNQNLFGFFREYRSLSILIIVIIQNVSWIDNRLWELGVIEGLIHLHDPQENYTSYQVYDLENLSYLLYRMDKMGMQKRKAYSIVHGYKRGHFLNLPEDRRKALELLSNKQKAESRKRRKQVPIST